MAVKKTFALVIALCILLSLQLQVSASDTDGGKLFTDSGTVVTAVQLPAASAVIEPEYGSVQYLNLVQYWAPTIYQDVNDDYNYRADVPTRFDYDGNWAGLDNWDHLNAWKVIPTVYYSVRETLTHYFIEYDFYYPHDDGPIEAERHENDLEGCILMIAKNSNPYGSLQYMETQAHNNWYQYQNDSTITSGSESIDGVIYFDGHRPKLYISANGIGKDAGHACWAWGNLYGSNLAPGGDGILFRYTGDHAVEPTQFSGNYTNVYDYQLVSMDQLWEKAHSPIDQNNETYAKWGYFRGDNGKGSNSCTLPWIKDDPDDGQLYEGIYWSDPAFFVDTHINAVAMSHTYIFNPYYTYRVQVQSIQSEANKDPFNDKSDVFIKISAGGYNQIDNRHWKNNQMPLRQKCNVYWGEHQTDNAQQYNEKFNSICLPAPINSNVSIHIYDKDGTSGDDSMGYYATALNWGQTKLYFGSNQEGALSSTGEARIWASVKANGQPNSMYHSRYRT